MRRALSACLILAGLTACGGGGSNNNVTPPVTTATVEGHAYGGSRQQVAGQALLAGATVQAFTLPVGATPAAVASTNTSGRYVFSPATGNALEPGRTHLIRVSGGGRLVSGLVNTVAGSLTKHLNEATHVAALALLSAGETSPSNNRIALFEQAARTVIDTALEADPTLDLSLTANQSAAAQLAGQTRTLVAGGLTANTPPTVTQVVLTPAQFDHRGGQATLSLTATDDDPLTVLALVTRTNDQDTRRIPLTATGDTFSATIDVPANATGETQLYQIAILVDDGHQAPTPVAVRTLSVLPEGRLTLDILAETLLDEPASRSATVVLDLMRPARVRRRRGARTRQVNPNQSIRNADIVVEDVPGLGGRTGADGLLLLEVPLSIVDDNVIAVTGSFAGRVTYTQFLVLPEGTVLRPGDTVEADLVLATANQWQTNLGGGDLGALNFDLVPLLGFFNVQNNITLQGVAAGGFSFRPITSTARGDDGDYLVSNLTAGVATVRGSFADPESLATPAFGPVELTLRTGRVNAVSGLQPPT